MKMQTLENKTHQGLAWVAAAGGAELAHDGRNVTGLPEQGWMVFTGDIHGDQSTGLKLHLHTDWAEPVSGKIVTLMCNLGPHSEGVAWTACVMLTGQDCGEVPARGHGVVPNFRAALAAAQAWRPNVLAVDGVELWSDPLSGEGQAIGLQAGQLTWKRRADEDSQVCWRFKPAGLDQVIEAIGCIYDATHGECDTLEQMLAGVAEARERIRAAMRKFLAND